MRKWQRSQWVVAVAGILVLAVGCDRDAVVVNDSEEPDPPPQQEQEEEPEEQEPSEEDPYDWMDYEASDQRDEDDEEASRPVGELAGSWRASYVDGDVPLAYFSIFHAQGEDSARGDFLMGIARGAGLDGASGQLEAVSLESGGDEIVIQWNPTPDQGEMYRLELERIDEGEYHGEFSAEMYPNTHAAELVKR